ncbi:hypothetical protein KIPB_014711, partial [Kipferlia bialata]
HGDYDKEALAQVYANLCQADTASLPVAVTQTLPRIEDIKVISAKLGRASTDDKDDWDATPVCALIDTVICH